MKICDQNISFGYPNYGYDTFFSVIDQKKIVGIYGKCSDRLFERDIEQRNCKILSAKNLGIRIETNGSYSYTGILNLLYRKELDIYMNPKEPFLDEIDEKWIKISMPIHNSKHFIFQLISSEEEKAIDLLTNFNFEFKLTIVTLVTWVVSLICLISLLKLDSIKRQTNRCVSNKIEIKNLLQKTLTNLQTKSRVSSTGIYLLFLAIHFFICRNIIQNCIKTNKVVIDVSDIIQDETQIFQTKKIPFYVEDLLQLTQASPKGTFLRRVYDLSDKRRLKSDLGILKNRDKVIFSRDQIGSNSINLFELFTIVSEIDCMTLLITLGGDHFGTVAYIDEKPVYEIPNILYYTNENLVNFMKKFTYWYLEQGIFKNAYDCSMTITGGPFQSRFKVFKRIKDYVDFKTSFDSLRLANFHLIFEFYFSINMLFFVFYLLNLSIRLCKRFRFN